MPEPQFKLAVDMGGVISKYPKVFRALMSALEDDESVRIYVLSDMDNRERLITLLRDNGFDSAMLPEKRILQADYAAHGEHCKRIVCEEQNNAMLIDDFPGYVASGKFVRLLVMPEP